MFCFQAGDGFPAAVVPLANHWSKPVRTIRARASSACRLQRASPIAPAISSIGRDGRRNQSPRWRASFPAHPEPAARSGNPIAWRVCLHRRHSPSRYSSSRPGLTRVEITADAGDGNTPRASSRTMWISSLPTSIGCAVSGTARVSECSHSRADSSNRSATIAPGRTGRDDFLVDESRMTAGCGADLFLPDGERDLLPGHDPSGSRWWQRGDTWCSSHAHSAVTDDSLSKMRSGVSGKWQKRTPVAFFSALAIADATGLIAHSPLLRPAAYECQQGHRRRTPRCAARLQTRECAACTDNIP